MPEALLLFAVAGCPTIPPSGEVDTGGIAGGGSESDHRTSLSKRIDRKARVGKNRDMRLFATLAKG
jgi:hypothetical protein